MDERRERLKRLYDQADRVQKCLILLVLAQQYQDWQLPPDVRERVELERRLWARRN